MAHSDPLLTIQNVVKNYQALRPLRIESLSLHAGDVVSIMGLDAPAAEMLVGLLTGAMLPDSGEIRVFNQSTASVTDSEAWLAMLDRVGIVTDRAVLIAQFTAEQNIAMPYTLEVDPVAVDVRPRVAALAREVGLREADLSTPIAQAPPDVQARVRLARALALGPSLLFAEHPTATLPREVVKAFAADLRHVVSARNIALLALTGDEMFASALAGKVLTHEPATGALRERSSWTKLFSRKSRS